MGVGGRGGGRERVGLQVEEMRPYAVFVLDTPLNCMVLE